MNDYEIQKIRDTAFCSGYNTAVSKYEKQNGELTDKVKELERQIEKMKCCYNCSKWYDGECEESPKSKTFFCADFKCDNWEIADD